jgi:hypothetical protein
MILLLTSMLLANSVPATSTHDTPMPQETKTREIFSPKPKKSTYKQSEFEKCGADEEKWNAVNGIHLTRGLVVATKNGFAPALQGDTDAKCEVLVVGKGEGIMGKLATLASKTNISTYSIIAGEMIGIPLAKFFLAPSLDPKVPPQFFPATCAIQNAKPQIVVTDPIGSDYQLVSLSETKLEAEPPKTSDSGAS